MFRTLSLCLAFFALMPVALVFAASPQTSQPVKVAPASRPAASAPARTKASAKAPKPEAAQTAKKAELELEKWITTLGEGAQQKHAKIRSSAFAGLIAVGKPALKLLKVLRANSSEIVKASAARAIRRIERGGENRGRGRNRGQNRGRNRSASQDPKVLGASLAKDLKLDAEKSKKLTKVLVEAQARRREVMQQMRDGEISREELREEMKEMREDLQEQFAGFLAPEQAKTVLRKMTGRRGAGGRNRTPQNRDV
ncbi:MAG: hypothetical protein V3W41_00980 [Planctomycetota bacterium]